MTMRKIDIIASVYAELDIPKNDSVRIVDSLFEIIKDDLSKGNDVMIAGFGKWLVKAKQKRNGRNPQTGEPMTLNARKVVTFKSSNVLRDAINP